MANQNDKLELKSKIDSTAKLQYISDIARRELLELSNSIEDDFFTVVVLGEFKRGKSTFINSLLKTELLPSDVLPETAVISAIAYNTIPTVEVVKIDGSVVKGVADREYLKSYSANGSSNINEIKYIKIGYPADFLKEKLIIVDTPGVDDINEQRCEVTYKFIPQAHAVLFVLDANSPLKNTEKEFIEKRLFSIGIENIVFVVNKYDNVDEDEEEEDLLDAIRERISDALSIPLKDVNVFPLSAKWAILGAINNDERYIEASGIRQLQKEVFNIAYNGNVEKLKINNYRRRFLDILTSEISNIENVKAIKLVDAEQLIDTQAKLESLISEVESDKDVIANYVEKEKQNIKVISRKSLQFFYKKIDEDIVDEITYYKGTDFKNYIEHHVAKKLRISMENWIASYSPHIDQLIAAIEREISIGISMKFRQRITLNSREGESISTSGFDFRFVADDVSNSMMKANILGAGSIVLMSLIGSSTLVPLLSIAALPHFREKALEESLSSAKDKVIPVVEDQIAEYIHRIQNEIDSYIDRKCFRLISNAEYAYETLLKDFETKIKVEIANKNSSEIDIKNDVLLLNSRLKELEFIREEL